MVLNAGDSKSTFWSSGVRLFLRYDQTMFSVTSKGPRSRLSASHMEGGSVGSLRDSLTHLDACHLTQAYTSLLLGFLRFCFSFFFSVGLGVILGDSRLSQTAQVWGSQGWV